MEGLGLSCLTPLSTLFQLYRCHQFYYTTYCCIEYSSPWRVWSWSYCSWIYNYMCNQCLLPLQLWVLIPLMVRSTRYNIMIKLVSDFQQVDGFLGYSGFLHQLNWQSRYNWNTITLTLCHYNNCSTVSQTCFGDHPY